MTLSVVLRRLAQAEFDDAADWHESRRAGRGAAFTTAVGRILATIAGNPTQFAEVHADIREALVAGYPSAIYYRIESARVTVLAVYHVSRDPAGWQARA
jgi:plasmid stabilization system protein ParE